LCCYSRDLRIRN